jgi:protein-S-isoprenylcysteine O-methyltransferase Ste14
MPVSQVQARSEWLRAHAMDWTERSFLLLVFIWFLARIGPSLEEHPYNWLLVGVEAFTAVLILIRKPGASVTTLYAWLIAIAGTCTALLALPGGQVLIPPALGAAMMLAGLLLSFAAKLFLNRSFGMVAANRGVKRRGPYRLVRHPMYLGYIAAQSGFLLLNFSAWNLAIYLAAWTAQLLRIHEEEAFLLRDEQYRSYAGEVRYRLVPGLV